MFWHNMDLTILRNQPVRSGNFCDVPVADPFRMEYNENSLITIYIIAIIFILFKYYL